VISSKPRGLGEGLEKGGKLTGRKRHCKTLAEFPNYRRPWGRSSQHIPGKGRFREEEGEGLRRFLVTLRGGKPKLGACEVTGEGSNVCKARRARKVET